MYAGAPQAMDNLRGLYEPHRGRVHTVAETCWAGTVIEHVAKMSIALAAGDSRALYSQAHIAYIDGRECQTAVQQGCCST